MEFVKILRLKEVIYILYSYKRRSTFCLGTNVELYSKFNKRSVLRSQSRDTNRNVKRSVYCRYG